MIRINLLGVTKGRRGKRPAVQAASVGGGSNMLVIGLVLAAIAAAGNYYYYYTLQTDAAMLQKKIQAAELENARLSTIKAKYMELEKQKDNYERRVNVIHQLQKNQKGPSELLTMIADTVNNTDAVWLATMKEDGNNVNLEGMALSVNAVANLMENLKKTGKFRSVEIKETFQDDIVKDMQAFQFTLTCERLPQSQKS